MMKELEVFRNSSLDIIINKEFQDCIALSNSHLTLTDCETAIRTIKSWKGYEPKPLDHFTELAKELGVKEILYKDESHRFGLGSFKALGGAYALNFLVRKRIEKKIGRDITENEIFEPRFKSHYSDLKIATATDGNHGRSVAWGAKRLGIPCTIFIHAQVSKGRQKALEEQRANVVRVQGNYDDSVIAAKKWAHENNAEIVSDTSYENYTVIPSQVMAGYSLIMHEVLDELKSNLPTHIFIQGGVGGLAAGLVAYFKYKHPKTPIKFIIVEPKLADCLFQSAKNQKPTVVDIQEETLMAGLSCGKVSQIAWEILQPHSKYFVTIDEQTVAPCMNMLAHGQLSPRAIEAGESAIAGLSALISIATHKSLFEKLELNEGSKVLLIGTEGATDLEVYSKLVPTH